MLHSAAFLLAIVGAWPFSVSPPRPSLGCYKSQMVLGESNVPVSSGRATTVVNIWVVRKPKEYAPLAWIYKNVAGQFWMQANNKRSSVIRDIFPPRIAAHILAGASPVYLPVPWRMPSLGAYDRNFARVDATRQPCFTRDLSSTYY